MTESPFNRLERKIDRLNFVVGVLSIVVVLLVADRLCGQTPSSEVTAAYKWAEANRVGSDTVFLTFLAVAPETRRQSMIATSYVLNSLSNAGYIIKPTRISDSLMAFRLSRFYPTQEAYRRAYLAWDSMAARDPYFHTQSQDKGSKLIVPAAVLGEDALKLAAITKRVTATKTTLPMYRADWFVTQVTVPPLYYEFTGIPATLTDYAKLLGLDQKKVIELRAVHAENIMQSLVTNGLRRVANLPIPNGSWWQTFDSVNRADRAKDPFADPTLALKFDASEIIVTKANGLFDYSLYLADGKRADAVDPALAVDFTIHPPVPLQPMISCVRCHNGAFGDEQQMGLRSFAGFQNKLLGEHKFNSADPATIDQVASLYHKPHKLQRELAQDRDNYAEAIAELTTDKATPESVGTGLTIIVSSYQYDLVTPAQACRELGIDASKFAKGDLPLGVAVIRAALGESNSIPVKILMMGDSIQRGQWEATYQEAAILAAVNTKNWRVN